MWSRGPRHHWYHEDQNDSPHPQPNQTRPADSALSSEGTVGCWLTSCVLQLLPQSDQRIHAPSLFLAGDNWLSVHPGAESGPDWRRRERMGERERASEGRGNPRWALTFPVSGRGWLQCVFGLWGPPVFTWTCWGSPNMKGSPEVSASSIRLPTSICALTNPASPTRKIPRSLAVQTLWGKMRHPVF